MDAMDGDQYFNATFGPTNGIPDFQPFVMRNKGSGGNPMMGPGRNDAKPPFLPPPPAGAPNLSGLSSADDSGLSSHFSGMSISGQAPSPMASKFHTPVKGRNPDANEFVPKSGGGSRDSPSLNHSASTPSFPSFTAHMNALSSAAAGGIANPTAAALALGPGASPVASPGMSPQGSPMTDRRRRPQSPSQLQANATSTPTSAAQLASLTTAPFQENVGGTTYFYTQEDLNSSAQQQSVVMPSFTMYPGILPHVAHMKPKSNSPSFFMPDEIKMEILNRHALTMAQLDPDAHLDIPHEVDKYHNLFPLEPLPANPMHKSSTFGYPTTCYRATNSKDGLPYCLRRIHGFRLSNNKCIALIDLWKKIQHSSIVQLREVFTSKAFGDHSMVFVYDFHPASETLMLRHFAHSAHHMNGYNNPFSMDGGARPYSAKGPRGRMNAPRHGQGLLPESVIWSYIVQLSSALRTIHAHGLACRVMDPTKILFTDKSRIRMNCVGIFDILSFDASQANPLAMMPHYQQEDLVSMGKVVLALACNSIMGIQREHIQQSMELVSRSYSADLKNLILYLLTNQSRLRSVNDIMPMIGARFYTQLDSANLRNDILENELAKEVENGRLMRLLSKMGTISERPEFQLDPSWAETGDRYLLKLYRDHLFHQVDENGAPWIDLSHIVQSLNKLDAGSPEKVSLVSRDEQSVLVVSYAELKQFFEQSFTELQQAAAQSQAHTRVSGFS